MKKTVTIGLIQAHIRSNPQESLDFAYKKIEDVAQKGAEIICPPELFEYPYFCQEKNKKLFALAQTVPGPTTNTLTKLAKKTGTVILIPLFEKTRSGRYYNSVVIAGPRGNILGVYHKMHIPSLPPDLYAENYYFSKGDKGFIVVNTPFGKIAPMVCYDQWFPEGARIAAARGADILFYPTAIGWPTGKRAQKKELDKAEHDAWQIIQRSHAIANNVFVVAVNRVGVEGNLKFWGTSFICDPYGRVLHKASAVKEDAFVVSCDLGIIEQMRIDWPFLDERRVRCETTRYV